MYSLRLLGGVLLQGASGPLLGRVVQRRQFALLALMGCARDRRLTRDKLIGYLWPVKDGERARRHLSKVVGLFDTVQARMDNGCRPFSSNAEQERCSLALLMRESCAWSHDPVDGGFVP